MTFYIFRDPLKIFVADGVVTQGMQRRLQHAAKMGLIAGLTRFVSGDAIELYRAIDRLEHPLHAILSEILR